MTDYISREAILSEFENRFCVFCPNEKCVETCKLAYIKHAIQCIPAADVESARKGTWVLENGSPLNHEPKMLECFFCDQCGELAPGYPFWECHLEPTNYCPNCGAKMADGGDTVE